MSETQTHHFKPVFDKNLKFLILNPFLSVVFRNFGFCHVNPQNHFWGVPAQILNVPPPTSIDEKVKFLLVCDIAICDAAISCETRCSSNAKMTACRASKFTVNLWWRTYRASIRQQH